MGYLDQEERCPDCKDYFTRVELVPMTPPLCGTCRDKRGKDAKELTIELEAALAEVVRLEDKVKELTKE